MTIFFPSSLFVCPINRLFVDVYQGSLSLSFSLSLSLCVTLSENISPTSSLRAPTSFFFSFSLFHWPRAPRGDGTLGSFDIGMLLKALQRVRTAREPRCPTDTHFMLMSCPGSSIRERGNEKGPDGGRGGLTPPSFLGSSHMFCG